MALLKQSLSINISVIPLNASVRASGAQAPASPKGREISSQSSAGLRRSGQITAGSGANIADAISTKDPHQRLWIIYNEPAGRPTIFKNYKKTS
jgi:hypothetical protein